LSGDFTDSPGQKDIASPVKNPALHNISQLTQSSHKNIFTVFKGVK